MQGNSQQAMSLARGVHPMLLELQDRCRRAVASSDRSDLRRPAHTIEGKLEQAQRWLANPGLDDNGLGQFKLSYSVHSCTMPFIPLVCAIKHICTAKSGKIQVIKCMHCDHNNNLRN